MRKSLDISKSLDGLVKETAKELGLSDMKVIEVAVMNFVNMPLDTKRKLMARYHMLRAQEIDPTVTERTEKELTELLEFDITPIKKKGK